MPFIVFSETTCYFHEKKNIILFNSYFSFYFFQNLTNFDIDSDMFHILLLCLHAKFQQKILIIALVIAKLKYLTFDPLGGVKGGGVKL